MPTGVTGVSLTDFSDVLALWLTRSPLSDLATATRRSPPFAWSAATLSLIATGPGRMLAGRALADLSPPAVKEALSRAAAQIPEGYEEARRLAVDFAAAVEEQFRDRGQTAEQRP